MGESEKDKAVTAVERFAGLLVFCVVAFMVGVTAARCM